MKKQRFYREIEIIMFCKVCKVEFRPARFSMAAALGLCWNHRKEYRKKEYQVYWLPYYRSLTPERRKAYLARRYETWKQWVVRHPAWRRKQALESYHKRKHLHTGRKHRRTKKISGQDHSHPQVG